MFLCPLLHTPAFAQLGRNYFPFFTAPLRFETLWFLLRVLFVPFQMLVVGITDGDLSPALVPIFSPSSQENGIILEKSVFRSYVVMLP